MSSDVEMQTAEQRRLAEATGRAEDDLFDANPWYEWGPYLSERAWGTVREDYSDSGDAWSYFPHDHARSRAYRWNEDGMAGLSDIHHDLCLGLALWNGVDPILKERMFGLTGPQGNHGEDVKEYWWYLDALPSHAWLRWRYHYPQAAFPVPAAGRGERPPVPGRTRVRAAGHRSVRREPVLVGGCHLREGVTDRGAGPDHHREPRPRGGDAVGVADPVVPQHLAGLRARRRRRCSWTGTASRSSTRGCPGTGSTPPRPRRASSRRRCSATTRRTPPGCSGRRRSPRIRRTASTITSSPARPTVNPAPQGTKAAWWYRLTVPAGGRAEVRLRLHRPAPDAGRRPRDPRASGRGSTSTTTMADREREADEFYAALAPAEHRRRSGCGCCARPAPGWSGASRCTRTG